MDYMKMMKFSENKIPNLLNEDIEILRDSYLNSLEHHCMTYYWKVRKGYLDNIKNSMSHYSLIGKILANEHFIFVWCLRSVVIHIKLRKLFSWSQILDMKNH
jgi:hypothetical protein